MIWDRLRATRLRFFKRFLPCKIGGRGLREAMTAMKTWGVAELWHRDPEVGMTCGWWKGCWGEWYRGKLCGGVFASLNFSCALGIRWKTRKTQVAAAFWCYLSWRYVTATVMCPEITWMFCEMLFLTFPYHPLPSFSNVFQALCSVPVWIPTLPGGASPFRYSSLSPLSRGRHWASSHFEAANKRINMNKLCFQGGQLSVRLCQIVRFVRSNPDEIKIFKWQFLQQKTIRKPTKA